MVKVVYTGTRQPSDVPGVQLVHMPMLHRVAMPIDDSVWASLAEHTGRRIVLFCSQNAVDVVHEVAPDGALDDCEAWAVGARTAALVEELFGRRANHPAKNKSFTGVVAALREVVQPQDVVVSFELADGEHRLRDAELPCEVQAVGAYRTIAAEWDDLDDALRRVSPQWVLFASSRAFEVFHGNLHHRVVGDSYRVAAIGKPTGATIREAGERVDFVAAEPDVQQILRTLADG